jgi:hypothetical protein
MFNEEHLDKSETKYNWDKNNKQKIEILLAMTL